MDNGAGGIDLAVYSKVTGAGVLGSSKLLTALQAASSDIQTSLGRSRNINREVDWFTYQKQETRNLKEFYVDYEDNDEDKVCAMQNTNVLVLGTNFTGNEKFEGNVNKKPEESPEDMLFCITHHLMSPL